MRLPRQPLDGPSGSTSCHASEGDRLLRREPVLCVGLRGCGCVGMQHQEMVVLVGAHHGRSGATGPTRSSHENLFCDHVCNVTIFNIRKMF